MAAKIAFRLVHEPTFKASVSLPIPGRDVRTSLELTFNYKTPEQLGEFLDKTSVEPPEGSTPEEKYQVMLDNFMEMASGWDAGVDFDKDNVLQALISYPTLASAAITEYAAHLMGQQQTKN